jgi:hypothetical protein
MAGSAPGLSAVRIDAGRIVIAWNKYLAPALKRRAFGGKALAALRSKDMAEFIKEREAESVAGTLSGLTWPSWNGAWKACKTPWRVSKKPKVAKGRERRLEEDEETRLLAAVDTEMQNIVWPWKRR